jgi:hypothetical protein
MKTVYALSGAVLLLAGISALGQDVQIKQRAKELRDQNNVRQGVAPVTQGAAATAAPSLPAPLVQFHTGLAGIKAGAQVDAEQKNQLGQKLLAAAQGAKPSVDAVNKLVADLAAAFAEKPLPASSRGRLMVELDAVLNPAKYPQAKADAIFRDIQAMFQENGLARNQAVVIAEDVKAISREIEAGAAK